MKPSIQVCDIRNEIKTRLNIMNEPLAHFNSDMGYFVVVPTDKKEIY